MPHLVWLFLNLEDKIPGETYFTDTEEGLMKQHKKATKRKVSKRARSRGRPANRYPSQPIINEDEMMNQIERITNALVDVSQEDLMADLRPDEPQDWENDEDWLAYLERSVDRLEQRLSLLGAISPEDVHESWKRLQEKSPEYEALPGERYLEQFVTSLGDKFRKALFFARIEKDAQRLRMAVREEVFSLCAQGTFQAHDFIRLPPALPEGEAPDLSERERAEITEMYCRSIWWMMADHYPASCTTHFYLECPEGWFSAEVYGDEEEAEQEAEKRRQTGEGDFEIREISEGDDWVVFTVLYSKQRPNSWDSISQAAYSPS